jgi:ankyrin repeat protein
MGANGDFNMAGTILSVADDTPTRARLAPMPDPTDPLAAFLRAACVPLDDWHGAGTLAEAESLVAAHPDLAGADVHAAAVLGDDRQVRRFIAADPACVRQRGGPYGWDPLTHLCFSRYLRLDPARSDGLLAAARVLLDAGADAGTGFFSDDHQPQPSFECVLYGAAGVAHHPELTQLLIERGADPNDGEVAYHAPESLDDRAMHVIVESGKLEDEGLTTMLHRKIDWQHRAGIAWLLEHGADPNRPNHPWRCSSALHHALDRTSGRDILERLLDHGGDPTLAPFYGHPPVPALAARRGRGDLLELFAARGFRPALTGDDAFFAACATGDVAAAQASVAADPGLIARLEAEDGSSVAEFAGAGNLAGLQILLDIGFAITSRTGRGGARGDTALHAAIWRERTPIVKYLLARGTSLEEVNGHGDTPLEMAVKALTAQSEWTPHDSTDIVSALLAAGARVDSVRRFPTGAAAADALLRQYGRT